MRKASFEGARFEIPDLSYFPYKALLFHWIIITHGFFYRRQRSIPCLYHRLLHSQLSVQFNSIDTNISTIHNNTTQRSISWHTLAAAIILAASGVGEWPPKNGIAVSKPKPKSSPGNGPSNALPVGAAASAMVPRFPTRSTAWKAGFFYHLFQLPVLRCVVLYFLGSVLCWCWWCSMFLSLLGSLRYRRLLRRRHCSLSNS